MGGASRGARADATRGGGSCGARADAGEAGGRVDIVQYHRLWLCCCCGAGGGLSREILVARVRVSTLFLVQTNYKQPFVVVLYGVI